MRATIRQLLVDNLAAVSGRVFEPHAANLQTPKPFVVVREGAQDPGEPWAAFSTIVEVWPFVARTSFGNVDTLAQSIIAIVHRARFAEGGAEYLADYVGSTGQDDEVTEWDALSRGLRFRVFNLGWLTSLSYAPDPVAVLRAWVNQTWPSVQTDPASWDPRDATPAIYWRLVTVAPSAFTAWGAWITGGLRAHIIAPAALTRLAWTRRLTEGLALTPRLLLAGGVPLDLLNVSADSEADPMAVGQVRLSARWGIVRAVPGEIMPAPTPGTPLNTAVIGGDAHGEVTHG